MATEANTIELANGLTDDELDTLLEHARIAEAAGQRHEARELVGHVIAELNQAGHQPLLPLRWIARLEAELGEYANASRWLGIARDVAVAAGQATVTLQIDLALARVAISAGDTAGAERCLAQIPCEVGPPPPTAGTAEQIAWWADALMLAGDRLTRAALRAEAALTVVELWRAAGRYRSAFALLTAARAALIAAEPRARIGETELLEATLLFEAGEIETAWQCVTATAAVAGGAVAAHAWVLRMRIAIRCGRLGDARREAARPVATKDPLLLGQIAAVRIALFNELNMYEAAHREALAAVERLAAAAPSSPLLALLVRAAAATELRARTAVASWELPAVPEQAFLQRWNDDLADPLWLHLFAVGPGEAVHALGPVSSGTQLNPWGMIVLGAVPGSRLGGFSLPWPGVPAEARRPIDLVVIATSVATDLSSLVLPDPDGAVPPTAPHSEPPQELHRPPPVTRDVVGVPLGQHAVAARQRLWLLPE